MTTRVRCSFQKEGDAVRVAFLSVALELVFLFITGV